MLVSEILITIRLRVAGLLVRVKRRKVSGFAAMDLLNTKNGR